MVLMHGPGLVAKLDDTWNEPFEVIAKLYPMTNLLAIPRRCSFCFSFCGSVSSVIEQWRSTRIIHFFHLLLMLYTTQINTVLMDTTLPYLIAIIDCTLYIYI